MKIGIIGFIDKNKIPYLEFYEKEIQKNNIEYNIIFWDRFNNLKTKKNNNEYTIHIKCIPGENKLKKLIPMFLFKLEVEKIINREQYTHLIVLTTIPGVLLAKTLLHKFQNKYILDIRDYTYEKYGFYKNIVEKLIEKSYFTTISSKGFLKFLPRSEKIITCHNISNVNSVKTYSYMYRTELRKQMPKIFLAPEVGDYPLTLYLSLHGYIHYIDRVMSCYRVGSINSWSERILKNKNKAVIHNNSMILMLKRINNYTNYKYSKLFQQKIYYYVYNNILLEKKYWKVFLKKELFLYFFYRLLKNITNR